MLPSFSSQFMQDCRKQMIYWSGKRDSNSRHPAWEAGALPTELSPLRSVRSMIPSPRHESRKKPKFSLHEYSALILLITVQHCANISDLFKIMPSPGGVNGRCSVTLRAPTSVTPHQQHFQKIVRVVNHLIEQNDSGRPVGPLMKDHIKQGCKLNHFQGNQNSSVNFLDYRARGGRVTAARSRSVFPCHHRPAKNGSGGLSDGS